MAESPASGAETASLGASSVRLGVKNTAQASLMKMTALIAGVVDPITNTLQAGLLAGHWLQLRMLLKQHLMQMLALCLRTNPRRGA